MNECMYEGPILAELLQSKDVPVISSTKQRTTYCHTDRRYVAVNFTGETTAFFQHPFSGDVEAEKLIIRNLPLEAVVERIQIENYIIILGPIEFSELPKPIIVRHILKPGSRITVELSGLKAGTRLDVAITVIGNHVECPTI